MNKSFWFFFFFWVFMFRRKIVCLSFFPVLPSSYSKLLFLGRTSLSLPSFLPKTLLIKPGVQLSIPSSSFSLTISPFIFVFYVSSRSLVGAERWQACVCLALLSAFLMSLKHRGSAYYGDEGIQAGQKVMALANRGPLYSSTPPSHLCSFSSPFPVPSSLYPF